MEFVDRTEEQKRLKRALNGEKSYFIVVYGRRRLGKSTLIKRVISGEDVYYMADQTERPHQIRLLAKEIGVIIEGFDRVMYPDWEALFETLNLRAEKRFTLCLDEFPYLVKSCPELPGLLQKLIDSGKLKYNLILCGSSQQLMQGLVLDSSAPLYGRADQILKLMPLNIRYLQEVLKCDASQAVEEYAVWGGVPRYWELRLQESDMWEAMEYHLMNSQGTLNEEPLRLFMDDMRDVVQTSTLLSVIGNGVNRLSEIAGRLEKPATSLSGPLDKLIQLGFIERELPFGEKPKSSKKSLYKVCDPFMDFYFRFVVPSRSLIELGRTARVVEDIKLHFSQYVSGHWEKLCRHAISGQTILGKNYGLASRWWGSVSREEMIELDVVAESTDGKSLLVGECKWSENENAERLLHDLLSKAEKLPFARGKEIQPVLFLKKAASIKNSPFAGNVFLPQQVIELID